MVKVIWNIYIVFIIFKSEIKITWYNNNDINKISLLKLKSSSKFKSISIFSFKTFWISILASIWLEMQVQLDVGLQINLNFDLRAAGLKFKTGSIFGFKTFCISVFELARNSLPARYSASKHFIFQSSSWLEIQVQLDIRLQSNLNFVLRAGSKFKPSSIFGFKIFWITIFELARNSNPARYSASNHFEFRSSSWFDIQSKLLNYEFRSSS